MEPRFCFGAGDRGANVDDIYLMNADGSNQINFTQNVSSDDRYATAIVTAPIIAGDPTLLFPLNSDPAIVKFTWSQTEPDPSTGSGRLWTTVNGIDLSAPMPTPTMNQKETTDAPIPPEVLGFAIMAYSGAPLSANQGPQPGSPNGFHLGWSGNVTLSGSIEDAYDPNTATSNAGQINEYLLDVELAYEAGDLYHYTADVFDDPSGGIDILNEHRFAGWIGDDGGGARHSGPNDQDYGVEKDTFSIEGGSGLIGGAQFDFKGGALGESAMGDNVGITLALRDGSDLGPIFVSNLMFSGTLQQSGLPPSIPPGITVQPTSTTVTTTAPVIFNVIATGTKPLRYQWHFNGQNIDGANQAEYLIANTELSHAGIYTVVVSNEVGSMTSDQALLIVETPLTQVFITPSVIGFGDVFVGETSSQSLTILNTGRANLNVKSVTSDLGDVLNLAETDFTVTPSSSHDLILTLSPTIPGAIVGTLTVTGNTADSPIQIPITGNALPQVIPNTPPVIASILNQVIDENSSSSAITFTISDNETSADQLVLSATSSNSNLFPTDSIVFGGSVQNRTVTISPSANQTGLATISISVGDGDLTSSVSFDVEVQSIGPVLHPSDNNPADNLISISELTAYAGAWKRGNTWPLDPNPIPIEYVTRAGALWKGGEVYEYNPDLGDLPLSWVNEALGLQSVDSNTGRTIRTRSKVNQSRAIRSLPSSFKPGRPVEVRIQVTPNAGNLSYAVEETLPEGWNVSVVNENGFFDSNAKKVRWGPFLDKKPRILTFEIIPNEGDTGTHAFVGAASFDGSNRDVTGSTTTTARYLTARFLEHGLIELTVAGEVGDLFSIEASSDLVHWHSFNSLQLDSELHRDSYRLPNGESTHFLRAKRINPERDALSGPSDRLE